MAKRPYFLFLNDRWSSQRLASSSKINIFFLKCRGPAGPRHFKNKNAASLHFFSVPPRGGPGPGETMYHYNLKQGARATSHGLY